MYDSPYYLINSNVDSNQIRQAIPRLTVLAEEYYARTKGLGARLKSKMVLRLLDSREMYLESGGSREFSAALREGVLVTYTQGRGRSIPWHTIQSLGFRQYVRAALPFTLPRWVKNGTAIYFGYALWTGDGMACGILNERRLEKVREYLKERDILRFDRMLTISADEWNANNQRNHDQAWTMVQFLISAENGKYRPAFDRFIIDIARKRSPPAAFARRFGGTAREFQKRYERWLTSDQVKPNEELKTRATVVTLTSFLARAHFLRMKFEDVEEFLQAAREGRIRIDWKKQQRLWLPQSLLDKALKDAEKLRSWSLGKKANRPTLVLEQDDGTTFTGTFTLPTKRHPKVKVDIKRPRKPRPAKPPARTAPSAG
ncbi:unnamed protein product [marine sediment metagenome]|uniref:Uncharacterized protein n=1 Tax=marine sediment metagenome TaxID=412755 RepID=X1H8F5_9ZZZZ